MAHRAALTAFLVLAFSGCRTAPVSEAPQPYRSYLDAREVMKWILDPATDVIWDSAGTIITAEGRIELAPTSDEDWERVRANAAIVAEAGNLLMFPGRAKGPAWVGYAKALSGAGELAMRAAEMKDADQLFDAGGQLYVACVACHDQYWIQGE